MLLIKIIKNKTFKAKNGRDYHYINYYLVTDSNKWISIKPGFAKDFDKLDLICDKVINEAKKDA